MHLAVMDLFRAKWSGDIHAEWTKNLLQNRPDLKAEQIARTVELMNLHVLDAMVTGYETFVETIELPDPDDRHVLAVAVACNADAIITYNLKDFPAKCLKPYAVEAVHPDAFIFDQLSLSPGLVITATKHHRANLTNPRKTVEEYLDSPLSQGLAQTVGSARQFGELL